MNETDASATGDQTTGAGDANETTGLPGLHSWRSAYAVVLGVLVFWIALLVWLTARYA
jgi:hypothetical protein